jgi:ribosomal-protein-alanine N-acetyltransferase
LLTAVQETARRLQAPVILEVAADNPAARALYARAGFREVGRRRNYYRRPARRADALILRWER